MVIISHRTMEAHDLNLLSLVEPLLQEGRTLTMRCSDGSSRQPEYTAVLRSQSGAALLCSRNISVSACVNSMLRWEAEKREIFGPDYDGPLAPSEVKKE